ncbi:MAG: zf-HC2 domain-containing protein [Acidobacteriota bacterium]
MTYENIKEKFADYLAGDLDEKSLAEVRSHVATCASCRAELESLSAVWTKLGVLPQEHPSPGLRDRFYNMLEAYKEGVERGAKKVGLIGSLVCWAGRLMPKRPVFQLALSFLLVVLGLGGGYALSSRGRTAAQNQMAGLRQEITDMRRMMAVSLLKQQSPSERLMGVSWSARLDQPDDELLDTLLDTLNHDRNVNVRLAAVDSLYLFYDHPRVKEGLVRSLSEQTSPLVQISLINLLVEIRERRAAEALRTLIQDEKLNPEVRKRAELGLAQLS